MYFVDFYNFLDLNSGNLKSAWEFSTPSTSGITNSQSGVHSGQFLAGANFYSNSGSGSFNGNAYAEIVNYNNFSTRPFCVMMGFDRLASGNCILVSNYSTGANTTSGFTIGINDNNKLYAHIESSGAHEVYVYDDIILGKQNVLVFNSSDLDFSLGYIDLISNDYVFQTNTFTNTAHNFKSNNFYIGGNPSYESKFGVSKFSGLLDQFIYISTSLGEETIEQLASGFKQYSDSPTNLNTLQNSSYTTNFGCSYTGSWGTGDQQLVNLFATGISNFFSSGSYTGLYTGLISGGIDSSVLNWSGQIKKVVSGNPTGSLVLFSGSDTNDISGSLSFTGSIRYTNDGYGNTVITYEPNFIRPNVQADEFEILHVLNESWKTVASMPSTVISGYNNYKLSGVTLITGNTTGVLNLKTKSGIVPSGISVIPLYNGINKRFQIIRNHTTGLSLYISGDRIVDYTVSNREINISGSFQDSTTEAIYDLGTGLGYTLTTGTGCYLNSQFYAGASMLFLNNYRLIPQTHYYETHPYDLLHSKCKNDISGTAIYSNDGLYWGDTGFMNSGASFTFIVPFSGDLLTLLGGGGYIVQLP